MILKSLTLLALAFLGGNAALAQDAPSITYAEHVAPLLKKHCIDCHRPGIGTPFSFLSYEDARRKGKLIAHVAEKGIMPPWVPERGHMPFLGERGLEAAEIALLREWVNQGMQEGDPTIAPPIPEYPAEGWRLGTPDMVVEMDRPYEVPAEGPDEYRNFVIPLPDLPPNTWVRGVEFKASAPGVVHHCLINLDYDGRGRMIDARDEEPGFAAMDQLFEDTRIAAYAVGGLPYFLPEGAAFEVRPGADLILETHFHPSGRKETEKSKVALYLTDVPPTRKLAHLQIPPAFGLTTDLAIPAGDPSYTLSHTYTLSHDVELIHCFPHAHYTCREIRAKATLPNGTERTLLHIRNWRFDWQEQYRFANAPILPAGTRIDIAWTFDNSENNPYNPNHPPRDIQWGHQTTDEMASLGFSVIPVRDEEFEPLLDAHHQYQKQQYRDVSAEVLRRVVRAELFLRFDGNKDNSIGPLELIDAITYWRKAEELNKGRRSWELEQIAVRRGLGDDIERYKERAIRKASLGGLGLLTLSVALGFWIFRRQRSRRNITNLILLVSALSAVAASATDDVQKITAPVSVSMVNGGECTMPATDAKATVLFFLATDCPIANGYAPEIERICKDYAPSGVAFLRVYPEKELSVDAIEVHSKEFGLSAPAAHDAAHEIVRATGARVTPEAVIITNDLEIAYRGRIDDRYIELGRKRPRISSRDLRDALDSVLRDKKPRTARTKAVGCFIPLD